MGAKELTPNTQIHKEMVKAKPLHTPLNLGTNPLHSPLQAGPLARNCYHLWLNNTLNNSVKGLFVNRQVIPEVLV